MRFPRDKSGSVDFSSVSEQAVSRFSRIKKRSKKNSKQQSFKPATTNSAVAVVQGSISIDTEAIALGAEERDLDSFDTSAFEVDQSKAGRNLYYVEEEKESASRSMSEELAQEADRE
eukprot:gene31007-40340_t